MTSPFDEEKHLCCSNKDDIIKRLPEILQVFGKEKWGDDFKVEGEIEFYRTNLDSDEGKTMFGIIQVNNNPDVSNVW